MADHARGQTPSGTMSMRSVGFEVSWWISRHGAVRAAHPILPEWPRVQAALLCHWNNSVHGRLPVVG